MRDLPSKTEEMLLLVVSRLQEDAFGLEIRRDVERLTGKQYSVGGIYAPLDRLVRKGWLTTEDGFAAPNRLGRPRRRFILTADGVAVLRAARELHEALWTGLPTALQARLGLT